MKSLTGRATVLLLAFVVSETTPRSSYTCPSRCQCFNDPHGRPESVHLVCKWEQLNTTVLQSVVSTEHVRTLTIRCPHHGKKASRPPDGLFQGLVNLDRLEIDRCIIETLPGGLFAGMDKLYSLIIKNARLPNLPQGLFDYLPNLMTLGITGSDLKIEPYALRSLRNLLHLDLSHNSLNFLANTLSSLHSIKVLSLNHNKLSSIDFRRLPPHLTDLSIRYNQVTSIHYARSHTSNSTLIRLDLSGNRIDFMASVGTLNVFPSSIKQLDLTGNRISLIQEGSLNKMKQLVLLSLRYSVFLQISSFNRSRRLFTIPYRYDFIANMKYRE